MEDVNTQLTDLCKTLNIDFINNSSFKPQDISTTSQQLHLNEKTSLIFSQFFKSYISGLCKQSVNESFFGSSPLKQDHSAGYNKIGGSTSTSLLSDSFNIESRYFGDQLKSLHRKMLIRL